MAVVQSGGALLPTAGYGQSSPLSRSSIRMYSGRALDIAALYRTQPNLRLVIRFLARNIASLPLKAYERVDETDRRPVDPTSDLGQFLRSPVSMSPKPVTRHRWIRGIVSDLALFDDVYLVKIRNPQTGRLSAVRIPPTHMRPVTFAGSSQLFADAYELMGPEGSIYFLPSDVIHLHGDNPVDHRGGSSSIESLRRILAEDEAAGEYREQFWNNAARMSGIITRPAEVKSWDDTKRDRFLTMWNDQWTGASATGGGTPILEDGMTYEGHSFSAKDSEYLGARRLTREECAAAYFIPPVFVGILENANFANIKEQHVSLYADTLGPWLDEISQDLELQLLPEFDVDDTTYLEFNIAAKLAGTFEEQAAVLQTATGAPWLERNEARARMNLPPLEDGDGLVVPLNVLVGGQASPTDAAPPAPGTLSRRSGAKSLPRYATGWEAAHRTHLASYFEAQGELVVERLRVGMNVDEALPLADWNAELSNLLFGLSLEMTAELGDEVASEFGGEFDVTRTETWLRRNADVAAARINEATRDAVETAYAGVNRRALNSRKVLEGIATELDTSIDELGDPFESSFLSSVRDVFAVAAVARAAEAAISRVTSIGQWARREAASQSGARTKTWISSGAPNSRHADLDGETVPVNDTFSNGAAWPGDPVLGIDETAGCQCELSFS